MRTSAIVCFVLAGLFAISAVSNLSRGTGSGGGSANVSYMVGACMPTVICLIAGLSLARKPK